MLTPHRFRIKFPLEHLIATILKPKIGKIINNGNSFFLYIFIQLGFARWKNNTIYQICTNAKRVVWLFDTNFEINFQPTAERSSLRDFSVKSKNILFTSFANILFSSGMTVPIQIHIIIISCKSMSSFQNISFNNKKFHR